jgi:hypothetical protein
MVSGGGNKGGRGGKKAERLEGHYTFSLSLSLFILLFILTGSQDSWLHVIIHNMGSIDSPLFRPIQSLSMKKLIEILTPAAKTDRQVNFMSTFLQNHRLLLSSAQLLELLQQRFDTSVSV